MGGPSSSYATASITLRVILSRKPHHCIKIGIPSVGPNIFVSSNSFSIHHFIDTTDDAVHVNDILRGCTSNRVARDSSVGIATGYGLDGPGIEYRWG